MGLKVILFYTVFLKGYFLAVVEILPKSITCQFILYVINGIDVLTMDSSAAVAVLGNSITDGRGSGTNKQNRWPDELARRFGR